MASVASRSAGADTVLRVPACAPPCSCCSRCAVRAPRPPRTASACGEVGGSATGTAPWSCPGRCPAACTPPCSSATSPRYRVGPPPRACARVPFAARGAGPAWQPPAPGDSPLLGTDVPCAACGLGGRRQGRFCAVEEEHRWGPGWRETDPRPDPRNWRAEVSLGQKVLLLVVYLLPQFSTEARIERTGCHR